ncbi:MAG: peptidase MA family metallohydrolase, partial [Candidatus Poribacteria bacterium]
MITDKLICMIVIILLFGISLPICAQYIDINKVNEYSFDWMTYKTTHFTIYYYPEASHLVRVMGDMAEVAYAKISEILEHDVRKKIPLILYKSHADFRQTNVITETLTEGVGGFSELLKYRVVIPFTGSMDDFQKVITHEITHVFQFDILYKNTLSHIYTGEFLYSPPLWFIEGMSEYMADDWNAEGEMVLKDAIFNNEIVPLTQLQDFNILGSRVYLGYKEGQSAVTFLAEKYGVEKLSEILRELAISRTKDMDEALKNTIGIDLKGFNEEWEESIKKRYLPEIGTKQTVNSIGINLTKSKSDYNNVKPVWSPSGDLIAYISETGTKSEIKIVSSENGEIIFKINSGLIDDGYESIRESGSGLTWSHNGDNIAFIANKNDKDFLAVVNIITRKMTKKLALPYDVIYSPSYSPDDKRIAFIGLKNGRSDVYILNILDDSITQMTSDIYQEHSVSWHPKEEKLIYSSERNGQYKLFLLDIPSQKIQQITYGSQNDISPSWSTDGKKIIFCSDASGMYDVYSIDVDKLNTESKIINVTKHTNIITGCFSPTLSPDQNNLALSIFHNYKNDIYVIKTSDLMNESVVFSGAEEPFEPLYEFDDKPIRGVKYDLDFSPDLIYLNFGYISGGVFQNTLQFVASDMMGDHRIMAGLDVVSLRNQPDFFAAYYYLKKRPDFGSAIFSENEYHIEGNKRFWQRNTGIQGYMGYPLNKYNRIDLFAGRYFRVIEYTLQEGQEIPMNRADSINSLGISYVRNKVVWTEFGPYIGSYLDISLGQAMKITKRDLRMTDITIEARNYIKMGRRSNLATRAITAGSFGT